MNWALAIDFGTSFTAAATVDLDGSSASRPASVEVRGNWRIPSAVLRTPDGSIVVGVEAQRQAALYPACFEETPKRRIGDETINLGEPVEVCDVIAALFRTVRTEAERTHGGTAPTRVCLTHPATWAETRLSALREAGRRAGFVDVELVAEPVAAATWYAATSGRVPAGGRVAVYDLGGGTFDAAVVEAQADGTFATVGAPAGIDPLGGVDFDFALFDHVGATIARRDAEVWEALHHPPDANWRRRRRTLMEEVRQVKEELSSVSQSALVVPETDLQVSVTRDELQSLVRDQIQRSAVLLENTIRAAGSEPEQLAATYLVGGSSRMPLAEKVVYEQLHVTPMTLDEPKQVVSFGALAHLRGVPEPAASADPSDSELIGTVVTATVDNGRNRGGADGGGVTHDGPPTDGLPTEGLAGSRSSSGSGSGSGSGGSKGDRRKGRRALAAMVVLLGVMALGGIVAAVVAANQSHYTFSNTSYGGGYGTTSTYGYRSTTTTTDPDAASRSLIAAYKQPWANLDSDCSDVPISSRPKGAHFELWCEKKTDDGLTFNYGWVDFDGSSSMNAWILSTTHKRSRSDSDSWTLGTKKMGQYQKTAPNNSSCIIWWGFEDAALAATLYWPRNCASAEAYWERPGNAGG